MLGKQGSEIRTLAFHSAENTKIRMTVFFLNKQGSVFRTLVFDSAENMKTCIDIF